jgi:hypothetical protein
VNARPSWVQRMIVSGRGEVGVDGEPAGGEHVKVRVDGVVFEGYEAL